MNPSTSSSRRSFLQGVGVLAVGVMMPAPLRALVRSVPIAQYGHTAFSYPSEYMVYGRVLSRSEIRKVNSYLATKWGVER